MKKLIFAVFAMMFAQCVMAQKVVGFEAGRVFVQRDFEQVASYKSFRSYVYIATDGFTGEKQIAGMISSAKMDYEEVCAFVDAMGKMQDAFKNKIEINQTSFVLESKSGVKFIANTFRDKSKEMLFEAGSVAMSVNDREFAEIVDFFAKLKAAMEKYPELIK